MDGEFRSLARAQKTGTGMESVGGGRGEKGDEVGPPRALSIEHVSHSVRRARSRMLCVQQLNGISVFDSTESTRFVEDRK